MSQCLLEGTKNYILSNFKAAISYFDKLIASENNNDKVLGYLYRGTCYQAMEDYEKSIEDFTKGIEINSKSYELKYKLAVSLFRLKKFKEADQKFREALIVSTNSEEREKLLLFQNKCKLELERLKEERLKKIGNIKFSNNWFQTDMQVIVTLDCNYVLNKSLFSVRLTKRTISVLYDNEPIYELFLSNAIKEKEYECKILTQKIELKLTKDQSGTNWITLDEKAKAEVQKYPTSMKKDFSAIDKQMYDEMKKEDETKPEGNDALMMLFKEIYANADEDKKRAMIKSYQTSGGTVLSCDWGEVKQKDYAGKDRPEAPKGQEWADEKK